MDCSGVIEKLSAYMDGALDGREAKQVSNHLSKCEACAREFATLRAIVEAAASVEMVAPPAGLRAAIRAATTEPAAAPGWLARVMYVLRPYQPAKWAVGLACAGLAAVAMIYDLPGTNAPGKSAPAARNHAPVAIARVFPNTSPFSTPTQRVATPEVQNPAQVMSSPERPRLVATANRGASPASLRKLLRTEKPAAAAARAEETATVAPSVAPNDAAASGIAESAAEENHAQPVVMASVSQPDQQQVKDLREADPIIRVKVAPPSISKDSADWIKAVREEAARRTGSGDGEGIKLIRSRF